MLPASVHIVSRDSALRRALLARLNRAPDPLLLTGGSSCDVLPESGIVVVPSPDCSMDACAQLVAQGCTVIILAAVLRDSERERYLKAGATAYVPMAIDSEQLLVEIRRIVGGAPGDAPSGHPGRIRRAGAVPVDA